MLIRYLIAVLLLTPNVFGVELPRIVGVPLADAGRGLIRVSETEIRCYSGKGATHFLESTDNGLTWEQVALPPSYPDATCMAKEAPSIARNPNTGEFLRVEPKYSSANESDGLYMTKGGLDATWNLVSDADGRGLKLSGILRSPIWIDDGRRVLVPGHGGGCWTWYSDDQGWSWQRSNKVNSPAHEIGGVHRGTRWNHGMVEATVVELNDGRLWMIARTAQDQHYESFSADFGETWSEAKPSRFYGTITMPTIHRLKDGRLLFLWSNTVSLPEVERPNVKGGEDVFTNRDALHAAISEDDGETWIGFREVILDEHRNDADYAVTSGSNDRGKHQSELVQLDDNRVLLSCGQHPLHRKLMIMDVHWLYEKERRSDLAKDGTRDWSTHQYIDEVAGHCGYNRTPGARVEGDGLRVLCVEDETLTSPNQGAVWNFPNGRAGVLTADIRLEKGGAGLQIALTDRWFNPVDDTVPLFASYVLQIDSTGKTSDGVPLLTPGKTHSLALRWDGVGEAAVARVVVDGKDSGVALPCRKASPNGISYVHFHHPAGSADLSGFSIFRTQARVE